MAEKIEKLYETTPEGELLPFSFLTRPDTKFAENEFDELFIARVAFEDSEEVEELIEKLEEFRDAEVEKALSKVSPAKAKKFNIQPVFQDEEDEEGELTGRKILIFKQKARIKTKDGRILKMKPALFDRRGKELSDDVLIYHGTKLEVNFFAHVYTNAANKTAGITYKLRACKINKLVDTLFDPKSSFVFEEEDEEESIEYMEEEHGEDTEEDF